MAGKRISKSAIDWVAFAERVPSNQKAQYQAFKVKSDGFLRQVHALPENPPQIDWAFYKKSVPIAGLVDQFEKQYAAFKVPYPADKATASIVAQEKQAETEIANFVKQSKATVEQYKKELEQWKAMIPVSQMTMDDFKDTFPDLALDPINRPSMWPHNKEENEQDWKTFHHAMKHKYDSH